jgi:drug/metabolite transporter (DMT)-like permease
LKDILIIVFSVMVSSVAQILLKLGMTKVGRISNLNETPLKLFTALTSPLVLAGLFVFALSALIWLIALSRVKLSIAYPMVSLGYVAVVMFSWLIFKEPLKPISVLGCATVIIGVVLISKGL